MIKSPKKTPIQLGFKAMHKYPPPGTINNPLSAQNVCLRCAYKSGYGGCCHVPEDLMEEQLPISIEDIKLIQEYTGLPIDEVVDKVVIKEEQKKTLDNLSPITSSQTTYNIKYKLKLNENKQCKFLEDGRGCTLGSNKPRVCLTFPFLPGYNGTMDLLLGGKCLAAHESDYDRAETLKLLGMTEAGLENNFRQMIRDTVLHKVELPDFEKEGG